MKTIDLTDIAVYPRKYKVSSGGIDVSKLVIEDIDRQRDLLASKKTQLMLGDGVRVAFKFGHNLSKYSLPENWVDLNVDGVFKILKIIPRMKRAEIELEVRKVKFID